MNTNQKLERWANREIPRHVDHMILEQDGQVLAFGRYLLERLDDGCAVYIDNQLMQVFGNRRTAMSWCVAHRLRQTTLAADILRWDIQRQDLQHEIAQRQRQIQRSQKTEFRDLVAVKLQPRQSMLSHAGQELEKCIKLAKYLQLKGFNNETLRTSGA
jgi:hypothetical protein